MNKKCASCTKAVYPTEELKCLDKFWHKGCFKCQVCNMTLNMKNYKGYNKFPYCNAHYPQTKFTAVADTPETRRIAENTKLQSNVTYHADFERQKGKKMSVVDDPETARLKNLTQLTSQVEYQGVRKVKEQMEQQRPAEQVEEEKRRMKNPGKISEYDPVPDSQSPYSARMQSSVVYDSERGQDPRRYSQERHSQEIQAQRLSQEMFRNGTGRRQPGSIADYDPINEQFGSINPPGQQQRQPTYQPPQPSYQPPPVPIQPPRQPQASRGMMCKALYDYTAADDDEVSFREDDLIINCQIIDAGWMTGTVEKTGHTGMLPSNYVERIN